MIWDYARWYLDAECEMITREKKTKHVRAEDEERGKEVNTIHMMISLGIARKIEVVPRSCRQKRGYRRLSGGHK